ncbi:vacuolar segregation subunit 7-domain-containing protein [Exophiala viscosa]|uniref:Vacuolar segregation subunit 7-domain-containing protein n=1 Tax=Exophiala viscosa TaxID=2486360 RepID=A0AAN6DVQ3_9EURO|nr:vacuolar segregation subunit 7-domain-containing protein [Exophiala viscosa]
MSGQASEKPSSLAAEPPDQSKSSTDGSPVRNPRSVSAKPQLSRSRKNSQEFSPTRSTVTNGPSSTVPSAAAVQRALSAQRPILQPSGLDGVVDGGRGSERSLKPGVNYPVWPTSPRLKSPPPNKSGARAGTKRSDSEPTPSNTSSRRLATVSNPDQAAVMQAPDNQELSFSHSTLRVPARGPSAGAALETVTESSVPTTPSIGPVQSALLDSKIEVPSLNQRSEVRNEASTTKDGEGSGGDTSSSKPGASTGDNGHRSRAASNSRPPSELAKRSLASLTGAKPKTSTDPPRTMTVETETVASVPQLLGPDRGISGRDGNGSVRTKPSNETIRPKKEKKRSSRKPASLHAGTVTSKADLFEAKVASAVDEADSSDSDETFVYESNPPDSRPRHHSRTPSATSLASQEQYGTRNKHGVRSGSHAIAGKKSMKFSNSTYNNLVDGEGGSEGRGSQRNTSTTPRHHHISRHGRPHHTSILDTDSPFTQTNKPSSPRSANNMGRLSRPNSPRLPNGRSPATPRKGEPFDPYDDAADDERAPLIGSVRINRNRHSRRPHSGSFRHLDYDEAYDRNYCGRFGGCIFLGFVVLLICVGIVTFVMALNRPLLDISIKRIQNVLASEQELMLDLNVEAVNPNLFTITVNDLDINLFAESPYVNSRPDDGGTFRWITRRAASSLGFNWPPWESNDGVDEGTDPIDEPEPGTQKMLLGRILEFDSPLLFEASPVRRTRTSSVGEIRLARPGNRTEEGGSARWEKVLQHQFDLIVRGVIKYQLPLSSKTRSAKVGSRIRVLPDDDSKLYEGNG